MYDDQSPPRPAADPLARLMRRPPAPRAAGAGRPPNKAPPARHPPCPRAARPAPPPPGADPLARLMRRPPALREAGAGRPTKKDRREMDRFSRGDAAEPGRFDRGGGRG